MRVRLGVDIGGTFTDVALDTSAGLVTTKVLTDIRAPESAIFEGIKKVCKTSVSANSQGRQRGVI